MKNQVIKNLSPEMGKKILKYWQDSGFDTRNYNGDVYADNECCYYGVIGGTFNNYSLEYVQSENAEIIELPKENEYPKVMWVSDNPITKSNNGLKRVVFMKKNGRYVAWTRSETIEESENETESATWNYAKDIEPEVNQEVKKETTLDDVAKLLTTAVEKLKALINNQND